MPQCINSVCFTAIFPLCHDLADKWVINYKLRKGNSEYWLKYHVFSLVSRGSLFRPLLLVLPLHQTCISFDDLNRSNCETYATNPIHSSDRPLYKQYRLSRPTPPCSFDVIVFGCGFAYSDGFMYLAFGWSFLRNFPAVLLTYELGLSPSYQLFNLTERTYSYGTDHLACLPVVSLDPSYLKWNKDVSIYFIKSSWFFIMNFS